MAQPTDRLDRTRYALQLLGFEASVDDCVLLGGIEIAVEAIAKHGLPYFLRSSSALNGAIAAIDSPKTSTRDFQADLLSLELASDTDLAALAEGLSPAPADGASLDELNEAVDRMLESAREDEPVDGDRDVDPAEPRYLEFPPFGTTYGPFIDPDEFPDSAEYRD